MKKYNYNNIKFLFIITLQLLILFFIFYKNNSNVIRNLNYKQNKNLTSINENINLDYENHTFSIVRMNCPTCGLFAYYKHYISCIIKNIIIGYVPIIDLASTQNIFNSFNPNNSNINPWEYFFQQPFGYTLQNVLKKSKKVKYYLCIMDQSTPTYKSFFNYYYKIDFWHYIANKYIPINKNVIKELNILRKKLFKDSNNILGVLARGTDFVVAKPKGHPIPPDYKTIIKDIKEMDNKNNYDYIFLTTEDEYIRANIEKEFKSKIKIFKYNKPIKYNYRKNDGDKKNYLAYNENIKGNLKFMKIYLINIIILSKCLDIITARTNGSIGAFIFSNGFRHTKIYFLGNYKR